MQKLILLCSCLILSFLAHNASGQQGWDPNGTTSVGGSATWNTSTKNWTPNGTQTQVASGSLVAWTAGNTALFCAGPSSSADQGTFTITVNTVNLSIGGIADGNDNPGYSLITISGTGSLTIPAATTQIFAGGSACASSITINVPINGTGPLETPGCGLTVLGAANTFTGGFKIDGSGGVSFGDNNAFGASTGTITWLVAGFIQPVDSGSYTIPNPMTHLANSIETFSGNSGGVTFSGAWTLGGANTTVTLENIADTITVSGAIGGAGAVIINKSGTGWSFNGANTYSGNTAITAGTLTIGGSGKLGSGAYAGNITNAGAFKYGSSAVQTLSGVISGAGTLTESGSGTLSLTAANTYTGTTTISGGTLQVNHSESAGTSGPLGKSADVNAGSIVLSGGTLQYSAGNNHDYSGRFSTAANQHYNIDVNDRNLTYANAGLTSSGGALVLSSTTNGGTLTLSAANTYTGNTTINAGSTLTLGSAGSLGGGTYAANIANSGTFNFNSSTAHTLSGVISGAGALNDNGSGILALTGVNTYTGTVTVNSGGVLQINADSGLGATSSSLNLDGGTLKNNDSSPTASSSRTITLGTSGGYFDAGWSLPLTINSTITGSGALLINQDGGNSVVLGNTANNYTGDTYIGVNGPGYYAPGTLGGLQLGASGVIPNGYGFGDVFISSTYAGQLDVNGFTQTINGLNGTGTVNNSTGSGSLSVGDSDASSTFTGVIENTGGTLTLTKVGSGTLSLGGANTYSGATTISSGTLQLEGSPGSGVTVGNPNFATPTQSAGGYTYTPSGATWTFTSAGIATNGSPWYVPNVPSPATQAAFIQGNSGSISQSISFPSTGPYQVSWEAVGRGGTSGPKQLQLQIDGNVITTFLPVTNAAAWSAYSSPGVYLTAGSHTVAFVATSLGGGADLSSCVTGVTITSLTSSGGSISSTPTVSIAAGATFDVSLLASPYTLSSSTTLSPSGAGTTTGSTAAAINGASGGTVSLGSQPVSLTFTPTTFSGDASHPALYISQGTLSLNGNAFTVNNASGTALNAGTYRLIQQASGNITSSGSYSVSVTGSGLVGGATASIQVSGGNVNLVVLGTPSFSGLTASQSTTYGTSAITLAGEVSATGSVYPANGETITVTINGNAQTTAINDSTGDFSFSYNPSTIPYSASAYTITYSYAGDASLNPASNTSMTLTVNQAALSITAGAQSKTYGQTVTFGSGSVLFTSSTLSNGETIGTVTLAVSGGGGAGTAPVSGSPYTITPSAAMGGSGTAANYNITYITNSLTVSPAALTVTADNFSQPYGATNLVLTVTYSNFVNAETLGTSDVAGSPALTTGAATNSPVGAYDITNSIGTLTSTNYSFSLVDGTLTVTNAISSNAVSSSENPALPGDTVTFTATLSIPAPSVVAPYGSVQFQIDGSPFGSPIPLTNGVAVSGSTSSLSHGYHISEADYAGDTNIVGSTNTLVQLINTPPVAAPATFSRPRDLGLIIAITNLLTNATDADGDALSLAAVTTNSTNGATIYTNAAWVFYSPPATNGNVTDTFSYTVADIYGATSTNTVTVTIQSDYNGPSVNITGITTNGNGTVTIGFAGIPSLNYLIQAATNLTPPITWTTLATNMAGTNGLFQYTDECATNYSSRYYRTSIPQD